MVKKQYNLKRPGLGEGIYFADDVAKILCLPYKKVYYQMNSFWSAYTFGDSRNKAINFYSLIEFYTFYHLREKGFTSKHIRKFHEELAKSLKTDYPFASIRVADREKNSKRSKIWYEYLGEYMRDDRMSQPSMNAFIKPFIKHVEYGDDLVAKRLFPLGSKLRQVVVDPHHQFGQPVISGTNLQTKTIFSLFEAGESEKNISKMFDISENDVNEAILFHKPKAA